MNINLLKKLIDSYNNDSKLFMEIDGKRVEITGYFHGVDEQNESVLVLKTD